MTTDTIDLDGAVSVHPTRNTPEGKLWASVLLRALEDAGSMNRDRSRKALRWLRVDAVHPGSCRWVCDMLDLDHGRVMQAVLSPALPREDADDAIEAAIANLPQVFTREQANAILPYTSRQVGQLLRKAAQRDLVVAEAGVYQRCLEEVT